MSSYGISAMRIELELLKFACSMRPSLAMHFLVEQRRHAANEEPTIWRCRNPRALISFSGILQLRHIRTKRGGRRNRKSI